MFCPVGSILVTKTSCFPAGGRRMANGVVKTTADAFVRAIYTLPAVSTAIPARQSAVVAAIIVEYRMFVPVGSSFATKIAPLVWIGFTSGKPGGPDPHPYMLPAPSV